MPVYYREVASLNRISKIIFHTPCLRGGASVLEVALVKNQYERSRQHQTSRTCTKVQYECLCEIDRLCGESWPKKARFVLDVRMRQARTRRNHGSRRGFLRMSLDHAGCQTRFWSAEKDRMRVWGPHERILTASRNILKFGTMKDVPWRR